MASPKTWNADASGSWNTGANWTPTTVPTSSDDVTLPTFSSPSPYTVTLSGTAGSANSLTISGTTATLDVSGVALNVTTAVDNYGTLDLVDAGLSAATLTNESNGFGAPDAAIIFGAGSSLTAGQFQLSGGTATIDTVLTYAGVFSQSSGTLDIASSDALILTGGNNSASRGTVDGSGVLLNQGNFAISSYLSVSGNAILRNGMGGTVVQTGDLAINGPATVENHVGGLYDLEGGTFAINGDGSFVNGGRFVSSGYAILGNSNATAPAFVNKSTGAILVSSGTLNLETPVSDAGDMTIDAGAVVDNFESFALDNASIDGAGSIVSYGPLVSSSTDGVANTIAPAFNNLNGSILVTAGILAFTGGLSDISDVTIDAGATLALEGSTNTIYRGIGGAGTFAITGGNTTFGSGASTSVAMIDLTGGAATIAADITYAGAFVQSGGTLDISSGSALILTGVGNSLAGGTIDGGGVLLNRGMLDISGSATTLASSAILRNGAGGTLQQTGNLVVTELATVENHTGGVYDLAYATIDISGNGASFENGGTFVSSHSASISGNSGFGAIFVNKSTGTISVTSGSLTFAGAGLDDAGAVSITSGATLTFNGGTSTVAGLVAGSGTLFIAAGTVDFDAGASVTASNFEVFGGTASIATILTYDGFYLQDGGTLDIASGDALILDPSGTSDIFGAGTIGGSGVLLNRGTFYISGGEVADSAILRNGAGGLVVQTGTLAIAGSAVVENHVSGTYDLEGAALDIANSGASFVNGGSFVSSGSAMVSGSSGTVATAFVNKSTGTISVTSGSLAFNNAGLDDSGVVSINSGATLTFNGGTSTVAGLVAGSGTLLVVAGTVDFDAGASVTASNFEVLGGTASIATVLTYGGSYLQDGGTLDIASGDALILSSSGTFGAGTIGGSGVLLNRGTFFISGGEVTDSAILRNGASATIEQSGNLTLADSARIENHVGGLYELTNASILSSGTATNFSNGGTFIANSSGLESIAATTISNSGTLNSQSGTLDLDGAVSNTGTIEANTGSLSVAGALSGTGADQLSGAATLTLGGSVASGQAVTFESGATGMLALGQAQTFAGTVAGLTSNNAIDLTNFLFSGSPSVYSVTGGGSAGATTDVTVKDGSQYATLDLLNQSANQYPASTASYKVVSDGNGANPGTLFELATHA